LCISERYVNSSPGLCLHKVLEGLVRSHTTSDKNPLTTPRIQIVFFDRPGLRTVFAEAMRSVAVRVVLLDVTNLETSRERVAAQQVDILLYLALPTEKFSYMMAHSRRVV
jgi:hypothetical protein